MAPVPAPGRVARTLRAPGYLILSFLTIQSIFDLLASMAPMLPRMVAWRVRSMGLTANALTAPLLALLLLYVLALASEHRVVLRILSVVTALGALALVAGSGILVLDALQLSRQVPAANKTQYAISALYALIKLGFGIVCLLMLTWVGLKAARGLKKEAAAASAKPSFLVRPGGAPRAAEPRVAPAGEATAVDPPVG